ncbi:hypothetical protein KEU06_09510 [Pseudaminobacter sp. 19-2017]|uniref:Uncharacterized protein n=1 Tax=Pseudaminobacter soli (ex Zhang et al. 2022) TaxID=2831468 RepID=A0A942I206_9HYPH|nr:hypothetical protein [Pseudaminobacter soli]MBS3648842.1 hypothetical protein [Pseudaminobacter soli]
MSTHPVDRVLDGWFGESVEDAEEGLRRLKFLYQPLRDMFDKKRPEQPVKYEFRVEMRRLPLDLLAEALTKDSAAGWQTVSVTTDWTGKSLVSVVTQQRRAG